MRLASGRRGERSETQEERLQGKTGLAGVLAIAAMVAGISTGAAAADKKFVVGVSNTLIGNGFREEMICSIKAEALASGIVSKVILANRNGGPPEQIADLRNLISAGANAIILNPSSRDALDPVIKQAAAKGIVVMAVDQAVSAPEAYVLTNDQVAYGKLGAEWLFKQLHGKGDIVEMRGIDGVPADADRHEGVLAALKEFPDIHEVAMPFSGWALNTASKEIRDLIASGKQIDGVWTSGIDAVVPEAYQTAHKPFVPVVGADNNAFIGQLIDWKANGLTGAAVTNPAAVGGAGLAVALQVLQGKAMPHTIKLTPEVWDNTTDAGVAKLKSEFNPKLDPYYGVAMTVPPYTTYTPEQIIACKGP
jgi:ribose transport system substrate-binding protein